MREAAAGGENVVYGDVGRKEALMAAGLMRASVVIVTVSDTPLAEKVLHHVQELRPDVPVVVRTADERDMERLTRAGAAEVVPETLEASLMLASHALVLVGIPIDLAELSAVQVCHCLLHPLGRPALGAHLADAVVPACRLDGTPSFGNVMTQWLFAVDVFTSLHRPNACEYMPMIRRRDADRVDILLFQHTTDILVCLRRRLTRRLDCL